MYCNEILANTAQLIAFPIEILGFYLMFIELFFREITQKITELIDKLENTFDNISDAFIIIVTKNSVYLPFGLLIMSCVYAFNFILCIALNMTGLEYYSVTIYDYVFNSIDKSNNPNYELFNSLFRAIFRLLKFFLYFIIFSIIISYASKLFSMMINILNNMTNGKALGSIGFILAIIGLSGEMLQVLILEACNSIEVKYYWTMIGALISILFFMFFLVKLNLNNK